MRDGGFQSVQFVSGRCHHHTPCTCVETIGQIVIIIIIIIIIINDNIIISNSNSNSLLLISILLFLILQSRIIIIMKTTMMQKWVQLFDGLFDCPWLVADIYLSASRLGKLLPLTTSTSENNCFLFKAIQTILYWQILQCSPRLNDFFVCEPAEQNQGCMMM